MDLTASIAPKSDQLNADDLMAGPVTVTILEVKKGSAEQPFDFIVKEFPGRAYRPSKSMRRVMVMCWGVETSTYAGHRLTLFRNPNITFGGKAVGGIEISAASHIDKPLTIALTESRGKRKDFTVQPLGVARDWVAELASAPTLERLVGLWTEAGKAGAHSTPGVLEAKDARKAELT